MFNDKILRRKHRIRKKVSGDDKVPRVSVYKSLKSIYVQAIDDIKGNTLCASMVKNKKNIDASMELSKDFSEKLKKNNVTSIKFDRNGLKYHGVIKVFAEGLRENGIKFLVKMKISYIDSSQVEDVEDHLITLNRVTKVVKGGRTFSFSALVVAGNKKGIVGLGFGKAKDIPEAIRKANEEARKKMVKINLQNATIPYQVKAKYCASKVILIPASEGTGVIAGGNIRSILQFAGVENILSKTYGSRNTINASKSAFKALLELASPIDLALEREIDVKNIYN